MQIVCPACASAYELPTERVGPEGRSVRCAACRETWFVSPDDVAVAQIAEAMMEAGGGTRNRSDDQAALDAWEAALADEGIAADAPAPAPIPAPAEPDPPRRPSRPKAPVRKARGPAGDVASNAALGLALAAVAGLALVARTTVVRAMPQSAALYDRIGLPVNLRGIDLVDVVAYQAAGEGGVGQLVIEGDLVGVAAGGVPVPAIEVEVRDGQDQPIYRWSVPAPRPMLEDRERARFRASLSAPPAQGRSVQVRFSTAGQASAGQETPKTDASRKQP